MKPRRIQMTRKAPWRADNPGAVIVARPTRWGNPFRVVRQGGEWNVVDEHGDTYPPAADTRWAAADTAVLLYRTAIKHSPTDITVDEIRRELDGRDLACWCPIQDADGNPVPCHADVLLAISRGEEP